MAKNYKSLGAPVGLMSQAVSDGELNMSARGCAGSCSSLPGTPGGEPGPANSVLSWAVSFERLLEDPCGVSYFTAFLRSEVSAENILFWQACEKFRKIPGTFVDELKTEARSIYNVYLSESAPYSVNIDDTAKVEEKDLDQPTPDMFNNAQAQIFKLMKMDSYRRFVRSPLYQNCTLASVESQPLPQLTAEPVRMRSWENVANRSPTNKQSRSSNQGGKNASEEQRQKRVSWGDRHVTVSRKESSAPVKSTSGVDLGSLYRQAVNGHSGPCTPEKGGGVGRFRMEGGYCCVYLPDGSASLAPTRPGLPIRDMLAGLCEKRGFPLKDVIIYLHGNDKTGPIWSHKPLSDPVVLSLQHPLSLEQDCSVLMDQQVSLELRVTFVLEIVFTGKTGGIVVKSSKTLQDALSAVLQKHHLKPQDALVTMVGCDEPVNLSSTVFRLANKTLRLDRVKAGRDQSTASRATGPDASTQTGAGSAGGVDAPLLPRTDRAKTQLKPSKNRDMDGFLDMLTRAQGCRVEDQRGLLTKEQLEVPLFLQLPPDQQQVTEPEESSSTRSSTTDSKEVSEEGKSSTSSSAGSESNLRETTV